MDLDLTPADLAFREEVRGFIAANLTEAMRHGMRLTPSVFPEPEVNRDWQAALHRQGWAAPGWPEEHGGPGWTLAQRTIFEAECARAGAPTLSPLGLRMIGPVLMRFGTPEQQARYLPPILSGTDCWCQGYSKPGSGSDLASLKTRAVVDGEDYIVNGTKIWTTHAHHANRMFALIRTAETPKPQQGISFLLIDMDSPGITVRPIRTIGGDHEVNQVFLDDVRAPRANRVGAEGEGWTCAKYLLEFERGGGIASPRLRAALRGLAGMAQRDGNADMAALATIGMDLDALEMLELRVMSSLQTGQNPGAISSILKLRVSQLRQAINEAAIAVLGPRALHWEPRRPLYGLQYDTPEQEQEALWVAQHLNGRAWTIFGGTSEVQLGIIAKNIVGV